MRLMFTSLAMIVVVSTSWAQDSGYAPSEAARETFHAGLVPSLRTTLFALEHLNRELDGRLVFDLTFQLRDNGGQGVGLKATCAFGDACEPFQNFFEAIGGSCTKDGPDVECTPPPLPEPLPPPLP